MVDGDRSSSVTEEGTMTTLQGNRSFSEGKEHVN